MFAYLSRSKVETLYFAEILSPCRSLFLKMSGNLDEIQLRSVILDCTRGKSELCLFIFRKKPKREARAMRETDANGKKMEETTKSRKRNARK